MQSNKDWLRYAVVGASLLIGAATWEVAGHFVSGAFWAPLSATLKSLGETARSGVLLSQGMNSLELYATGVLLAIAAGAPLGLLLARLPWLRVALEDYIMVLYATPMVALIPFILSIMGFGFAPKVLVVFLFAVFPVLYTTTDAPRSTKA